MSHNYLELLQSGYQNFAKGDVEAVLTVFDPNIEWTEAKGFPYGGTYTGHDSVVQNVFTKLATEWDGWTVTPKDFVDSGDRIVALGTYSGTNKETGKNFSADFAHVWTFRDGKAVKFVQYTDTSLVKDAMIK